MKKNIVVILVIVLGIGLTFFALNMKEEKDSTLAKEGLTNFAITDTLKIDKIKLSTTMGSEFTVVRNEFGKWESEKGSCVQNELITNLLHTIYRIRVKGPVAKGKRETVLNNLNQSHIKTEIYVDGVLSKTCYVGSPTSDHYGTFMLLELPDIGRSSKPMVTYIPGFKGNLQSRFSADWKQWACSEVFAFAPSNVKKITVENFENEMGSYTIESDGDSIFKISQKGKYYPDYNTGRVGKYILNFKKIHFNQHNYTIDQAGIDSIKSSTPYVKIQVEGHNGEKVGIVCYKMKAQKGEMGIDGEQLEWNQDLMWAILDNGDLVKVQYYSFDKIIKTLDYFVYIPKNVDK